MAMKIKTQQIVEVVDEYREALADIGVDVRCSPLTVGKKNKKKVIPHLHFHLHGVCFAHYYPSNSNLHFATDGTCHNVDVEDAILLIRAEADSFDGCYGHWGRN